MRALAASRLIPLVHPGNLPFGLTERGWVTIQEFAEQIRPTSAFKCIASSLWAARQLLQKSRDMPTVVVHGHYVLNQIDGGGFAIARLLRETAAIQWGTECTVSDFNQGMSATIVGEQMVTMNTMVFMRKQVS